MQTPTETPFVAIVGPTASGKTGLSLVAGALMNAEVVSMDSRQVYRGMDIGTGKVSLRDRARLPHHGLDLCDPDQRYSAGQFARDARGWTQDIRSRGRVPLLVGGTGFFLKALSEPLFSEPALDRRRLEKLRGFLNEMEASDLEMWAGRLDSGREGALARGGRQRQARAVEMALLTGRPLSWWYRQAPPSQPAVSGLIFLLRVPRGDLDARIAARVDQMLREGLVEEVERLLEAGYGPQDPGMTGAGYREIVGHLARRWSLEEARERITRSHRRYARRQLTWFRHQLPEGVRELDGTEPGEALAERVLRGWESSMTGRRGDA